MAKEMLGKLEVYDVENPDINPNEPGVQTYDIEKPSTPSKWERIKGAARGKYESWKAERAVIKSARREAQQEARHERSAARFQARVDTARGTRYPSAPKSKFKMLNLPKAGAMKSSGQNVFGGLDSFLGGFGQKSSTPSAAKSYRTKTVYKKVGKHYKKITRRVPIHHKATGMTTQKAQPLDFFGGLNQSSGGFNLGALAQPRQQKKGKQQGGIAGFRIGF